MKRIMLALLMAAAMGISAQAQEPTTDDRPIYQPTTVRAGLGYNYLLSPDLDPIADLPQSEVARNGIALSGQALLGNMPYLPGVKWGVELDYMSLYSYEIILPESDVTATSIPLLVLWEYPFGVEGDTVRPVVQWGAGLAFNATQTDTEGAEDTDRSTDLALMVAPGFAFRVTDQSHVLASLKYYWLNTPDERTQVFNVGAYYGWNF